MDSMTADASAVKSKPVNYLMLETQQHEYLAFGLPVWRFLGVGATEGACIAAVERDHAGARRVAVVRAVEGRARL